MEFTFAFSPCPNDTFMFEPIVNQRIDLMGLKFHFILDDVEKLNNEALKHKPDITKLSYHTFAHLTDHYSLLNCGSALGRNCGPLLISKALKDLTTISDLKIAIPGQHTTAFFLLKYAYPQIQNVKSYLFSEIEQAILNEEVDAGVIIHENRFTYSSKGLVKILDLGQYWEQHTGYPIPLGGIAIKKEIPNDIQQKVDAVLRDSITFAMKNPASGIEYIKSHAQEMEEAILFEHIKLYVNHFSLQLGKDGKNAVQHLVKMILGDKYDDVQTKLFVSSDQ